MSDKPKKFNVITKTQTKKSYIISIWDNIESYEHYSELYDLLEKISKEDNIELRVSTPGGRCDVGFDLIDRFVELDVDVVVPYPTYSMGAVMSLCGKSLKINPGGYLMFHDFSTGTGKSKGNEIHKYVENYRESFECRFKQICQPFLTNKECKEILNGQDLYIKWNEPDLKERIRRHFK